MALIHAPITVKSALPFCSRVHRRLPNIKGAMWAVGAYHDGELIGVALVGFPARVWNGEALQVLRVAVMEGHPNACSRLYGACSRAARAMGARNLVTYTHLDESGVSLRAAGWVEDGITADNADWGRKGRPRQLALDPNSKRRWWAAWSERVKLRAIGGPPRVPEPKESQS